MHAKFGSDPTAGSKILYFKFISRLFRSADINVRASIHLGGQTEFCPNRWGGSSRNYPGAIFSGGGSSSHFPCPIRWGGVVAELFPLNAVTDPKFVLLKHVLCFARIMSTLCPKVCQQSARIGGCPPCPPPHPVRL